jgi:hypothetical protein
MASSVKLMKIKCKVLSEYFSDEDLQELLDSADKKESIAIYLALVSAYSVAIESETISKASQSYVADWEKLLNYWKKQALQDGYTPPRGAFVLRRER